MKRLPCRNVVLGSQGTGVESQGSRVSEAGRDRSDLVANPALGPFLWRVELVLEGEKCGVSDCDELVIWALRRCFLLCFNCLFVSVPVSLVLALRRRRRH
ncbi:hypothetical protein DL98DRAFT_131587 [Cadophora sp. DSE1049]|nr:hypothetical protein DL98DRAFT_131587 [Cadophora sp. DSE1049]